MGRYSPNGHLRLAALSTLTLAIVLLAACSIYPTGTDTSPTATGALATVTATALPLPTSLKVIRYGGVSSQNHVAPFQRTVEDAASVQRLYQAVYALPPPPTNVTCPEDPVIGYQLTFLYGDKMILQVLMSGGGCPVVAISHPLECHGWSHEFITQLAATLKVSETSLVPVSSLINTAGPNGPFAPYGPTPPILTNFHCGDQFPNG